MATITYTVTVATGTNAFGTGSKFFINGTVSPALELQEGNTYVFDQTDGSNAGQTLAFSIEKDGTHNASGTGVAYTSGVTTAGSKTTIVIPANVATPTLFYYDIHDTTHSQQHYLNHRNTYSRNQYTQSDNPIALEEFLHLLELGRLYVYNFQQLL